MPYRFYPSCTQSQTVDEKQRHQSLASPERLLPGILIGFYYLTLWKLPFVDFFVWSWFLLLGLAMFAFLLRAKPLNLNAGHVYIVFAGLHLLGGFLSLLRAVDYFQALYNLVGGIISFATILLVLQILLSPKTRTILLMILMISALFWALEIQFRTNLLGDAARLTFSKEADKNFRALQLSMASVFLLAIILFWPLRVDIVTTNIVRGICGAGIAFLAYSTMFLYSRTGLGVFIFGLLSTLLIFAIKRGASAKVIIFLVIITAVIVGLSVLDDFYQAFPYWETALNRIHPERLEEFNAGRVNTFKKSIALISQNPIVGIGSGMYKFTPGSSTGHSLGTSAHNTYLGAWVEHGMLGFLAFMYWIYVTYKIIRFKFDTLSFTDRAWLLIMLPFFFMLAFLDLGGQTPVMISIISVIHYNL